MSGVWIAGGRIRSGDEQLPTVMSISSQLTLTLSHEADLIAGNRQIHVA